MDKKETVKYREEAMELAAFIKESPTPFHVTANIGVILEKEGFMPLQERDRKSTRLNSSHRSLSRMPSSA